MRIVTVVLLSISLFCTFQHSHGYNILGICPSASYSHQQSFQALMKALAFRGHKVTVLSTIPLKNAPPNYEDVDLSFSYIKKDCTGLRHVGAYAIFHQNLVEANLLCRHQLFSPAVDKLIASNKTFDAIIIEQLWYQCYYALVKHYNFPVLIGFLSVGNLPYVMDSVGNPDDPNFNPDMTYPFTDRMTINERIMNILYTTYTRLYYRYWHLLKAQRIANERTSGTSVYNIDKNFSLVILGNNHVFGYPKPLLPHVIEVHTCHTFQVSLNEIFINIIFQDVQEFLDNAQDGAIYFSLGSNLQTDQLPAGPLTALCNALGSLKQRVLWKHAGNMAIHATNIKFVKWVPQQAVLGHPKVVAYMMQGGLQSLQEAVHYAVPVVAIPFFGDQYFNARKILDAGIGLTLDIDTITENAIVQTLTEIVKNKTYLNNIKTMSAIVQDELMKPIDRAVWHVEHVLKFPNSRHLRYHGQDMSWIHYYATYLYLGTDFALLLYISYILYNKIVSPFVTYASNLKRWISNLKRKLD
ncbi:UDP-glucuronosyltransferase 2B15 [Cyphomyrmex costatus]|uniref:UDP-glucuronosyltransferase n=1 Tax=Cyphomyrmex costatus TaxID=456900 RepID=A0A195C0X5_9HYME|nr:UDP-glucuronosyltransferase 2B15 [Cyphomyrmex costatus]